MMSPQSPSKVFNEGHEILLLPLFVMRLLMLVVRLPNGRNILLSRFFHAQRLGVPLCKVNDARGIPLIS